SDEETKITNLAAAANAGFAGNYISNVWNFSQLPASAFYNTKSTIASGVQWGTSLYAPTSVASTSGYTKGAWVPSAVSGVLTTASSSGAFAADFKPNHSELLPIPQ